MGKARVTSPSVDQSNGSSILKIKNCHSCGAEYARKGTLCGSCRGIRHRLLKKERERKNSTSPPSGPLTGSSSTSPSPLSPISALNANLVVEDTYVELPPIHIPIPARTKEAQRERLVSSITSCSRCDSHLECQRCFALDREVRRLNQERLDLQKQLSDMEIEVHAMRLQLMNEMRVSVASRQLHQTPQFMFNSVNTSYPDHHHSGVSVCQLVN